MEGRYEVCCAENGTEGLWACQLIVGFRAQTYQGCSRSSCYWEGPKQATPTWQANQAGHDRRGRALPAHGNDTTTPATTRKISRKRGAPALLDLRGYWGF